MSTHFLFGHPVEHWLSRKQGAHFLFGHPVEHWLSSKQGAHFLFGHPVEVQIFRKQGAHKHGLSQQLDDISRHTQVQKPEYLQKYVFSYLFIYY